MKAICKLLVVATITVAMAMGALITPATAEGEKFVFVYHSPDSDSWWNVIKNAIKNAEKDMGVSVDVRNPPTGDDPGNSELAGASDPRATGYPGAAGPTARRRRPLPWPPHRDR